MAGRKFTLNTEPHVAEVGPYRLLFKPEVRGAVFAESYDKLRAAQSKMGRLSGNKASSSKHAKDEAFDASALVEVSEAVSQFVRGLLLDEEAKQVFDKAELPDRVLFELMEWVAELYGGGSGNPDAGGGTSSS